MRYCVAIVVLATLAAFVWAADTPAFRDPGYVARYLDQHSEAFVAWLPTILTAEQLQQVEAWVYGQVTDADRADGQELKIQGDHDTYTVKFDDGTGLQLNGNASCTLGKGDILCLVYNAGDDVWYEMYRSNN